VEDPTHVNVFYRVGRSVVGFIAKYLGGRIDILTAMNVFSKIAQVWILLIVTVSYLLPIGFPALL